MQPLVLDTNVVLDAFVFADAAAAPLVPALQAGQAQWLATAAMREELGRVLGYPQIARRLQARAIAAEAVLADFDRHAVLVEVPPKAPVTCGDPDDQKFIDLAVARSALLLSKDGEVLRMRKRLERLAAAVRPTFHA